MDLLVVCVFAYWLMRHLPEVVNEAAEGLGFGLRGEESPAAQARRERLKQAGIDPAVGGAFRQYAGNMMRDFWLDQDAARAKRRADRAGRAQAERDRSRWQSLHDRLDGWLDDKAGQWQCRQHPAGTGPQPGGQTPPGSTDPPPTPSEGGQDVSDEWLTPDPDEGDSEPIVHNSDEYETKPGSTGNGRWSARHGRRFPGDEDYGAPYEKPDYTRPRAEQYRQQGPIRVDATVGDPIGEPTTGRTATAVLELDQGASSMSATVATRGIPVTGIQSGAQECLSIDQALQAAISEFQARLAQIAGRTHQMGNATLGIVQFAGNSTVVTRMAQAAEAIAATQAQALALGAEVSPLLHQTRAEFLRRS